MTLMASFVGVCLLFLHDTRKVLLFGTSSMCEVKQVATSSLRWSFMCFPAETMCCFQDGAVWDIAVELMFLNSSRLP